MQKWLIIKCETLVQMVLTNSEQAGPQCKFGHTGYGHSKFRS